MEIPEVRGDSWGFAGIRGDSWGLVEIRGDSWRFVEIGATFVEIRGTFVKFEGSVLEICGFRGVPWCFVGLRGVVTLMSEIVATVPCTFPCKFS